MTFVESRDAQVVSEPYNLKKSIFKSIFKHF
jgi:hypothetical protein